MFFNEILNELMNEGFEQDIFTCKPSCNMLFYNKLVLPTDIKNTEDKYIITIDTPNFKKEDAKYIDIELKNKDLIINFDKSEEAEKNKGEDKDEYLLKERSFIFKACRTFTLPLMTNNIEEIEATLDNGVLVIIVPKEKKPTHSKIQIK